MKKILEMRIQNLWEDLKRSAQRDPYGVWAQRDYAALMALLILSRDIRMITEKQFQEQSDLAIH